MGDFGISRRQVFALGAGMLVTACDGGGSGEGGFVNVPVTPSPTPTPTPTPTAREFTVGPGGWRANLAEACGALSAGNADARQILRFLAFTDNTKGALPDYTDLIGQGLGVSQVNYSGPVQIRDDTRVDNDPLLLRGNHKVAAITIRTKNSNYPIHSESAGVVKDWVQVIEDVELRHDGMEEAWNWSRANGGVGISAGGRWIPAFGCGMSSGASLTLRRVQATSLKGGGIYVHNTVAEDKPCSLLVEGCTFGSDQLVSSDVVLHSIGSGKRDVAVFDGNTFLVGTFSLATTWLNDDPAQNPAMHNEWDVTIRRSGNLVIGVSDPGRALRVRKPAAGSGSIRLSGFAASVLLGPTMTLMDGDEGLTANAYGYFDVAGGGYTTAGTAISLGSRLGDCSSSSKQMTVTIDGVDRSVSFARDYRGVSNETILSEINSVLDGAAIAELWAPGNRYYPNMPDQQRQSRNVGAWAVNFGTAVVYDEAASTCRSAEPTDFVGANPVPGLHFGIALEDIRRGATGRIQTAGWVINEMLLTNAPRPNQGDGFIVGVTSEGKHGMLIYAGPNAGAFRCVRPYLEDGEGRYTAPFLQVG